MVILHFILLGLLPEATLGLQQPNPYRNLTREERQVELKTNVKRLRYWQGHLEKLKRALRISLLNEEEPNRRTEAHKRWMEAVKPELEEWGLLPKKKD